MITKSELDYLFHYEPETGNLIRKVKTAIRTQIGGIAGSVCAYGYIKVKVNSKTYPAHRLIWVMVYGSIDSNLQIDHINGDREDNKLLNLRLVSRGVNMQNQKTYSNNTSGVCGVSWYEAKLKWVARININGNKRKSLGYFTNKEDAIKARKAAEIEYGFHENHGRS